MDDHGTNSRKWKQFLEISEHNSVKESSKRVLELNANKIKTMVIWNKYAKLQYSCRWKDINKLSYHGITIMADGKYRWNQITDRKKVKPAFLWHGEDTNK